MTKHKAKVVQRKNGQWWTDFRHPEDEKKRIQWKVESEEAGWIRINQFIEGLNQEREAQSKTEKGLTIKQAPVIATNRCSVREAYDLAYPIKWKDCKSVKCIESHIKFIEEEFGGGTQMIEIPGHWIRNWQKRLQTTLTNSSINRRVSVLRTMRTVAVEEGILTEVPEWPKNLPEKRIAQRYLHEDEVVKLRKYFRKRANRSLTVPTTAGGWRGRGPSSWTEMEDVFVLRLNQGSRSMETLNLTPRHVRFRVNDEVLITFTDTKTGDDRTLKVYDQTSRQILRRRCEGKGLDEKIFRMQWRTYTDNFRETVRELELPGRVTGHITRGTFATNSITGGTPLPALQHVLGHRELESTSHYAHNDTRQQEIVMNAVKGIACDHLMEDDSEQEPLIKRHIRLEAQTA